jgi:RNA polymerase sigma-70 factor (ECF subfamily)
MSGLPGGPTPESFEELLRQARAGSREALGKVLDRCRRYLLRTGRGHLDPSLRSKAGESDMVQHTFLEAQRDFPQFRGATEREFLAWLCSILLHNIGTFHRHYRDTGKRDAGHEVPLEKRLPSGNPEIDLLADARSPGAEVARREQQFILRRVVEQLPDRYRRVIYLRALEGFSFETIGWLMDCSPDAARMLYRRALREARRNWPTPAESSWR